MPPVPHPGTDLALYVHWPYCARICPYCDFNVVRDRGRVEEQAALVEAIRSGHVAEATLDVFHEEPLPPSHPLWDLPQVLVTPHLASVAIPRTAAAQIVENLRRIARGEGPLNAVEPARGY